MEFHVTHSISKLHSHLGIVVLLGILDILKVVR